MVLRMSLRADHAALRGMETSAVVFGRCRRVSPRDASGAVIGRDGATRAPVLCATALGRGRVVCFGGHASDAWGADLRTRLFRWLVCAEDIRVASRRASGMSAAVAFTNHGTRMFDGQLGIALPVAAKARQLTVDGKPASVARTTVWGSTRYVYVPVAVAAQQRVEVRVTADRRLVTD